MKPPVEEAHDHSSRRNELEETKGAPTNMFDIEKAISDWRRQMRAAGIKNDDALNELESHLRDEIQQQTQAGLTPQQAFEAAVTRIGGPQALNTEFTKLRRAHVDFLAKLKRFLLMGS